MTSTYKTLWTDDYLENFALNEFVKNPLIHYWEDCPKTGNPLWNTKFSKRYFLTKFLPALGVFNIDLGNDNSVLVFMRGNRCHEISPKTLLSVCKKVNYHLGDLGQELNYFIVNYKCLSEPTLETIKSLYDLKPLKDKRHIAYRFFMNGWIEITKDGISDLKQYGEIPDGYFVWNSSIIPHEYLVYETKQSLEDKLHFIQTEQLHPITKEKITKNQVVHFFQKYRKKIENFTGIQPPTHYRDFIHNLSRNHKGAIDDDTLTRLKLAIGYLIHGYHIEGNRKAVVAVERFNIGMDLDSSNGGTGKSVLFKTLKGLVNYVEVNGKDFTKSSQDKFAFAKVNHSTELVHMCDAKTKTFDVERLFNQITDEFHIRRSGQDPFSISAENAPKICVSSNSPLVGSGSSFNRRQFIVEIGGFYRDKAEKEGLLPNRIHGNKHLCSDEWEQEDWTEFYRFVFECLQFYLSQPNGLPQGNGSSDYEYRKLVEETDDWDMSDWLIEKIDEYEDKGGTHFAEIFYRDFRKVFPDQTKKFKDDKKLLILLRLAANVRGMNLASKKDGLSHKQKDGLWHKWVDEGMEFVPNRMGKIRKKNDKVGTFTLEKKSSLLNPSQNNIRLVVGRKKEVKTKK